MQNDLANVIEIHTIYSNHVKKILPIKLRGIDKRLSKVKKTSTRRKTKESLITEIKDIYLSIIDLNEEMQRKCKWSFGVDGSESIEKILTEEENRKLDKQFSEIANKRHDIFSLSPTSKTALRENYHIVVAFHKTYQNFAKRKNNATYDEILIAMERLDDMSNSQMEETKLIEEISLLYDSIKGIPKLGLLVKRNIKLNQTKKAKNIKELNKRNIKSRAKREKSIIL